MSVIKLTKQDQKNVVHLRECLNNKSVDIGTLENLLTSLEGKINNPFDEGQRSRKVHKTGRMSRHLMNITGTVKRA
jgi:hypothetical protein